MSREEFYDEEGFEDVISLLREGPIDLTDEQPSPSLWAGIADELGLSGSSGEGAVPPANFPLGQPQTDTGSNVVSLDDRRARWGRPAAVITLAAAVVLLLAVPVGLSLRSSSDSEIVAAAELDLLEGQSGEAVSAEILSVDGDLVLDVDAPTTVAEGEFLEVWLLEVSDAGVESLESLGRVDGSGRYDVPDDVDLARFTVVDISIEPDDGNPDHSGVSVVRGELA